jgi:hypothetical protein
MNISNNTNNDEKYNKIIQEQSAQMIELVDISNAHSKENEDLLKMMRKLSDERDMIKLNNNYVKELSNLQLLLCLLLGLLLFWFLNKIK